MKLRFQIHYFILTLILLLIEVLIAVYMNDAIVRPYIGDLLVVILLYCFVKTFLAASVSTVASGVLLFSFLIETGQYFHLVSLLGLDHSAIAKVILGNSFAGMDLLMYVAGIICILIAEWIKKRTQDEVQIREGVASKTKNG